MKAGVYDLSIDAEAAGGLVLTGTVLRPASPPVLFELQPPGRSRITLSGVERVRKIEVACEARLGHAFAGRLIEAKPDVEVVGPKGRHRLRIETVGGWWATQRIKLASSPRAARIAPPKSDGGRLYGRVVDARTGVAIQGATVSARVLVSEAQPREWRSVQVTGDDGAYSFAPVSGRLLELRVEAETYAWWPATAREGRTWARSQAPLAPGVDRDVLISLERGLSVRGTVVADDGQPVGGARLLLTNRFVSPRSGPDREVTSASDGGFVFEGLNRARYHLLVLEPRWLLTRQVVVDTRREQVDPLQLTLHPTTTVSGVVLGPDERPMGGARVLIHGAKALLLERADRGIETITDDRGAWSISGIVPLPGLTLSARQGPLASSRIPVDAGGDHVLRLNPRVSLRLVLTGRLQAAGFSHPIDVHVRRTGPSSSELVRLQRSEDGSFTAELAPGRWRLRARQEGQRLDRPHEFEILPGNARKELSLSLRAGHTVEGRLVDGRGAPVHDAVLSLEGTLADRFGGRVRRTVRSDHRGRFVFRGTGVGEYRLTARAAGRATVERVGLRGDERDIELVLAD